MDIRKIAPSVKVSQYGRRVEEPENRIPPVSSGLVGLYDFDSWTGSQWSDISGNNNHATTIRGTISTTTITSNGSSLSIDTLQGNTSAGLRFPTAILPATYTLFHVARYATTGTESRIFDGVTSNWLSGFWGGNAGVAYHDGWLTSQVDTHGKNWVISTDQNSLYRSNGVQRGTGGGGTSKQLSINYGFYTGERSDWNVAFVAVYNRTLNSTEYGQVESWLSDKYGISI